VNDLAKAKREIVLDLDGPILDVSARHCAVYAAIARELGFEPLSNHGYWEAKRVPLGAKRILERTGAGSHYDVFARRWLHDIELDRFLAIDALQPDAVPSLERWSGSGYRMILATMRQDAGALARQLAALDIARYFDEIVVCDRRAGATGKAGSVAARTGSAPDVAYWIGDTEIDVLAARERGSIAWAVSCGLRDEAFLRAQHPDRLVASLSHVVLEN
jgi:phosphoglycolate phosphatase